MNEKDHREERGQSIIIVAIAMLVLLIFVVIAVDLAYAYVHRRGDQNAADAAALAGARELADILNANYGEIPGGVSEKPIQKAMNTFAENNGIEDTNNKPGDTVNTNVVGYYLDQTGSRLSSGGTDIRIGQARWVNPNARGVEAIVYSVSPSFFGGILGLSGLPIQAEAAVILEPGACAANCLAPIATLTETFVYSQCYNIWDGPQGGAEPEPIKICSNANRKICTADAECDFGTCDATQKCTNDASVHCSRDADCVGTCEDAGSGSGNFGWLNWSWQGANNSCKSLASRGIAPAPDDCSEVCLGYNLGNDYCLSGLVEVDDWVGGVTGVKNAGEIRGGLDWFIDTDTPFTVIIYDAIQGTGCGKAGGGTGYHVVGFAEFQPVGYQLSKGRGCANPDKANNCVIRRPDEIYNCQEFEDRDGNQIAGLFRFFTKEGFGGNCDDFGISVPTMIK